MAFSLFSIASRQHRWRISTLLRNDEAAVQSFEGMYYHVIQVIRDSLKIYLASLKL